MTERITPEQETGKPPSHVLSSALIDAANSLFCQLLEYERKIEHLTALVAEQKQRIDWLLDARGGAAYDASVVEGFIRDGDALRNALRDALQFVTNVPIDAMQEWHAALHGTALVPPPAREEGVTTDGHD